MRDAASGPYAGAPAVASALLHSLWQGALLAVFATVVLALMARRSAAARHVVGLALLGAMLLAPIATFVLARQGPSLAPLTGSSKVPLVLRGSDWLAVIAPLAWLVGAGIMLVRQIGGWRAVIALSHASHAEPPRAWVPRFAELRSALGIDREVAVRSSRGGASPFTARAVRPVIWLPAPRWSELPPDQRTALLAHELAHVRRRDWLWNGVQRAVEALLFFHPAVWWLGRRVRQERELACDDLAVAACGDPLALAEGLAALAGPRRSAPALALTARSGSVVVRVRRLLDPTPPRPSVRAPLGLVGLLGAGLALAAHVDVPRDVLVNLRVDTTASGALTPGTFREITAESLAGERHYRADMDPHGAVREQYEEDGRPAAIDGRVRAWLDALPAR
jgi:beta-lactamase regulating signal transducer with metallopeptidase domain